ncbi:MAG: hypothetical protein SPL56_09525 [Lachnospiraceae bacterium]|nr:hypothetical protein [Lachnospiraceae bacterium]
MQAFASRSLADIKTRAFDAELSEKSPMTYVEASFPPTFLIYGQLDQLRLNALADGLKEKGVNHTLYKSTGIFYGQHTTTMIFKGKKAFACFEAAMNFLNALGFQN